MADNSGLIKIGIFGAAAYLAYKQGWLSFLGIGSSTTAASTTTPASTAGTQSTSTGTQTGTQTSSGGSSAPSAPSTVNVLDGIYTRMAAAANAPSAGLGVDQWGWYLNQQLAPYGKTAPDPVPLFSAMVDAANKAQQLLASVNHIPFTPLTYDRSEPVTAATYWGIMAPALRSQLGLSGLGFYGGLGAVARGYR